MGLLAYSTIIGNSAKVNQLSYDNTLSFDTDSAPVGIDNRCSGCISHQIDDFEGEVVDCNWAIKGFGGTQTTNVKMGTLIWKWLDDDRNKHKFWIPKSYYVPDGKVRLLSPQHWAKTIGATYKAGEKTTAFIAHYFGRKTR